MMDVHVSPKNKRVTPQQPPDAWPSPAGAPEIMMHEGSSSNGSWEKPEYVPSKHPRTGTRASMWSTEELSLLSRPPLTGVELRDSRGRDLDASLGYGPIAVNTRGELHRLSMSSAPNMSHRRTMSPRRSVDTDVVGCSWSRSSLEGGAADEDWATAAREQMFRWAGHVARMELFEPQRWAARALAFKDKRELEHQKFWQGTGDHLRGAHYWRFERPIENFFGTNWRTKAHPKETWEKSLPE